MLTQPQPVKATWAGKSSSQHSDLSFLVPARFQWKCAWQIKTLKAIQLFWEVIITRHYFILKSCAENGEISTIIRISTDLPYQNVTTIGTIQSFRTIISLLLNQSNFSKVKKAVQWQLEYHTANSIFSSVLQHPNFRVVPHLSFRERKITAIRLKPHWEF